MKDSGAAWIGEIPQGWEIKRMKDCFISNSRAQPNKTVLSLSYGKVIVKDMEEKKGVTPESFDSYQGVHPGDVVLRLTDLQNDQKSLRVGRATTKGIITSAYLCVSSRSLNDRYSAYLLHDVGDIQKLFYGLGGGVRQSMKFADLAELLFSLPTPAEQRAIADYLDRQTALIDQRLTTLAEKKAVLAELRKATIHEAVTKGLNKNAPMKDSGVAWIGEIPQGWEIKRMKDCFISNSRAQPNKTVLSLSYGKVIVKDMEEKKGVTPESFDSYQGVHPGDVVLRLTDLQNDQKSLRVGRATTKGIITSAYLCVSSRSLNDRYSAYLLHDVGDIQKLFYGLGGGVRQSMKFADLAELLFSLPTPAEQRAIADYLDRQTALIDTQLATLDEQAQVLKVLRKAIIHEAVTGKIDLSGYVPQTSEAQAA
ncbi:putative type I site-specific restriction-modification system, S subunit [Rhodoferax ferrireducens T118]|uniref:Putative type I site-specific restriction-modification system, S subunit n=1 Tax=Albidiferax ferrireducens (strain ATCC BAA-621 / DSM 15236 / T118) TaxID=338969 RepID=Q21YQ3_ALBFT|nr:restriction endonuclease subunit S [Rhodoferax ferrireducens]ABD69100.1 putative type I site-specific restriction-modification system, S subunit [Rhodoferax ferrireducens T118]